MMPTQPDAAEKVLQESDGAMHYKAIVEEAVRQGLITRTENNAGTIYANVRAAIASDTRFVKISRGTFDLAARQTQSDSPQHTTSKDMIPMTGPRLTDDVGRNVEAMLSALDKASGVLEIPMERVRDVFGHRRNSSQIAQEIEGVLRQQGVGHFPTSLNVKQHVLVFLYRIDSVAGRLVKAARQGEETDAKQREIVDRIRAIITE